MTQTQKGTNGPVLFGSFGPKRTGPNGAKLKGDNLIMNNGVKKAICIASTVTMCGLYTLPIYAINEKDTMYCNTNNIGVVYKETSNGEEKNEDMPIDTSIKYYLDGNEISIDDLKGKSGKVKIEINFTNKDKKTETIDGKQVTMYTPYIVACGTILDNEKFSNVTISSGKIIDNGTNSVVLGISMPGMQESLNIDEIDIPENVIIEADAKDFELGNMYMYIESNVFDNDFDFFDKFDGLYEKSQTLKNASNQLVSGSQTLKDGANTYSEKMNEFNNGVTTYANGVNTVSSNYSKINAGITSVSKNSKKIAEGSSNLSNGIKDLKSNLANIISAIGNIKTGLDGIDGGISKMETAVDGSIQNITESTSKNSETAKTLTALGTATETSVASLKATKKALETTVSSMEEDETKTELLAEIAKLDEQITALGKNTATERAAYNKAMEAETNQVLTGLNTLKTSLETLKGVSSKVTAGMNTLVAGSPELQAGLDKLEDGSNTLSSGAKSLSDGTSTLSSGAKELKNGIDTLNSNTETIKSSSKQLNDAAKTISDGATTLSNGMKQFDNDGINTIYNLVNGDVKGAQNRIEKLMDLAKNSGSYKYILKVDNLK